MRVFKRLKSILILETVRIPSFIVIYCFFCMYNIQIDPEHLFFSFNLERDYICLVFNRAILI